MIIRVVVEPIYITNKIAKLNYYIVYESKYYSVFSNGDLDTTPFIRIFDNLSKKEIREVIRKEQSRERILETVLEIVKNGVKVQADADSVKHANSVILLEVEYLLKKFKQESDRRRSENWIGKLEFEIEI